jgi:hypothetical protein
VKTKVLIFIEKKIDIILQPIIVNRIKSMHEYIQKNQIYRTGGTNFVSKHPQKIKNKGAGIHYTYFEGSGKNFSQCGVNRIPKKSDNIITKILNGIYLRLKNLFIDLFLEIWH